MTAHQNAGTPPDARADRAPLHRDRRHPAVTLATFFVSHLTPFGSARRRSLAGRNPSIIFSEQGVFPVRRNILRTAANIGRLSNAEANDPIAIGSWPATVISGAVVLVQREKDYLSCSSR
jgi:hypothetical protein